MGQNGVKAATSLEILQNLKGVVLVGEQSRDQFRRNVEDVRL